jgi:hypothetical protein
VAACALALASPVQAVVPPRLNGSVGPGFQIALKKKNRTKVTTLTAGRYRFVVRDYSGIHNFHLMGPGVNKATSVSLSGTTTTWTINVVRGTYRFFCDVHRPSLKGSFRVS